MQGARRRLGVERDRAARAGALAAMVFTVVGCANSPPPIRGTVDERSQAMSLAWDLLADERKVDGLLVIKSADSSIAELLKEIATACGEAADRLEAIAEAQEVPLDDSGLPPAEVRVRAEIAAATTRELLFTSGATFERRILLTQVEALGYGAALLAEVSGQLEAAGLASEAEAVAADGNRLASLRKRVVDLLAVTRP